MIGPGWRPAGARECRQRSSSSGEIAQRHGAGVGRLEMTREAFMALDRASTSWSDADRNPFAQTSKIENKMRPAVAASGIRSSQTGGGLALILTRRSARRGATPIIALGRSACDVSLGITCGIGTSRYSYRLPYLHQFRYLDFVCVCVCI